MVLNVFFQIVYQILKTLFQFISLTNFFSQIYFTLKSIFYKMTAILYFLFFSFVSKNLTNYERRHLKLFTNCHVSWDTLYVLMHLKHLKRVLLKCFVKQLPHFSNISGHMFQIISRYSFAKLDSAVNYKQRTFFFLNIYQQI